MVLDDSKDKKLLINEHNRRFKVPAKNIISVHHDQIGQTTLPAWHQKITTSMQSQKEEIDTQLLWESSNTINKEFSAQYFSEDYFNSCEPLQVSAVFECLLEDNIRFKRKGLCFIPRSPKQVQEQLQKQKTLLEKQNYAKIAEEWIRSVIKAEQELKQSFPEKLQNLKNLLELFLYQNQNNDVKKILDKIELKISSKEAAYQILLKTGHIDPDASSFLILAGINEQFPQKALQAVSELQAFSPDPGRKDFTHLKAFSIDDEETKDYDDAFTVTEQKDCIKVSIHISDVTHFISRESTLNREAAYRASSIYLPSRNVNMFPDSFACETASLVEGQIKPTVTFEIQFDKNGAITNWDVFRSQIKISKNLSYTQADVNSDSFQDSTFANELQTLFKLSLTS